MCYAKPGPRRGYHTRAALDRAIKRAESDPSEKNLSAVTLARSEWHRTPEGIEHLRSVGHDDLAALYEQDRTASLAAYNVTKRGEVAPERKIGFGERLAVSSVTERDGWTKSAVDRFLGAPDATKPNPAYRSGASMRLYDLSRVLEAEASPEFRAFVEKNKARRAGAAKAVQTRTATLLEEVNSIPITLTETRPLETVRRAAFDHWEKRTRERMARRGENYRRDPEVTKDFSDRITVNFLRHSKTEYDDALDELYGRVGRDAAYHLVRGRVLDLIAERYPELADECARQ